MNQITLRIRLPSGELELQGTKSDIDSVLDDLPKIVKKVNQAFGSSGSGFAPKSNVSPARSMSVIEESEEVPQIQKPSGLNDAIVKLLSTSWGNPPRKWSEIDQALKQNAQHYSRGSITGALAYLVRSGRLRRVPVDGVYCYRLPPQGLS